MPWAYQAFEITPSLYHLSFSTTIWHKYYELSDFPPEVMYTCMQIVKLYTSICSAINVKRTGWARSYRKYLLQITQPSQYWYAKIQYRFAVTSGSPSSIILLEQKPLDQSEDSSCSINKKKKCTYDSDRKTTDKETNMHPYT